jgi:hypothetical protein
MGFWANSVSSPNFVLYAAAVMPDALSAEQIATQYGDPLQAYRELTMPTLRTIVPLTYAFVGTTYTLTSAAYVPNSITATGVTPRIVRTKS